MNKKEQKAFDDLARELEMERAMRITEKIEPDLEPPKSFAEIVNGWGFNVYNNSISKCCTSAGGHNYGGWGKTTTQQPMRLYSSEVLAYKALRAAVSKKYAEELARIDRRILGLEQSGVSKETAGDTK